MLSPENFDLKDFSYKICEKGNKKDYFICPFCEKEFHKKGLYTHVARTHFNDISYKNCGRNGYYGSYSKNSKTLKNEDKDILCEFGCNQKATYILGSGKYCCESVSTKCPVVRKKNSDGLKRAHKENRVPGFNNIQQLKSNINTIHKKIPDAFKKESGVSNTQLKKYMLGFLGYFYRCEICGIDSWNNNPIRLELDHVDGDRYNNELTNLRLICPNCHSQTPTYGNKGNKSAISDEAILREIKKGLSNHRILTKFKLTGAGNYTRINRLRETNAP